jgi:hypothetical protein
MCLAPKTATSIQRQPVIAAGAFKIQTRRHEYTNEHFGFPAFVMLSQALRTCPDLSSGAKHLVFILLARADTRASRR